MRPTCLILLLLFSYSITAQDETEIIYKAYSYHELFEMIQNETDAVFRLENALIKVNKKTDQDFAMINSGGRNKAIREDTLVINIPIVLDNVHFENQIYQQQGDTIFGILNHIRFQRKVDVLNTAAIRIDGCLFDDLFKIRMSGFSCQNVLVIEETYKIPENIRIQNSSFRNGMDFFVNCTFQDEVLKTIVQMIGNDFHPNTDEKLNTTLALDTRNFGELILIQNRFHAKSFIEIQTTGENLMLFSNDFNESVALILDSSDKGLPDIRRNVFKNTVFLHPPKSGDAELNLSQFQGKMLPAMAWLFYISETHANFNRDDTYAKLMMDSTELAKFLDKDLFENENYYIDQARDLGRFYSFFKSNHNTKDANTIFIELKDLETRKLALLYEQNPSFDTFFQWKINQFLKIFSDYGTKPSKAIVFAVYVIAFFAAIYLFYPNSWDGHGRMRIMDRYRFFLKYLNRKEGASEVYQEEKEKELMPFHEFREVIEKEGKTAPRFFYSTALPLYKWSISGTRLSGWFLSKIDVLNGTWSELPKSGRWLKTTLVIGAFILALIYDLFIKVLNAVMLSINTFTTLGFGEIPIKGLPRYLAIIQGFIGWFMLTIFSVSLISQLLN